MNRERENGVKDTCCLACGYDVVGLGDEQGLGICPECGGSFDLMAPGVRTAGPPWQWRVPAVILCVLCIPAYMHRSNVITALFEGSMAIATLICVTMWMWREGKKLWHLPTSVSLLLLSVFVFRLTLGFYVAQRDSSLGFNIWLAAFVAHGVVWYKRSRDLGLLAVLAGIYLVVPGVFMTAMNDASGAHWSTWPDPRPGQVHRQYPLTQVEVMWSGATLAIAGALLVVGGYISHIHSSWAEARQMNQTGTGAEQREDTQARTSSTWTNT